MGYDQQPAAIHSIRHNPTWYRKNQDRKSAEKSRQTQLEGRVGDLIDLPRNSYSGDLAPHRREEKANPEKAEISLSENLPGRNLSRHRVRGGEKLFFCFNYRFNTAATRKNRRTMHRSYLMAPMVKPAMKRSTKKLYRIAMGTLAIKQPAMRDPQKYTSPWVRKVGTPTLTVMFRTDEIKVTA